MMALHVGLRRARPLAGIVGFSGMLAGPEILKDEIKSRPPVLLAHGDSDEMLPHVLTERAAETLQQNDVAVAVHIAEGVGHGIDQTALSHAARFLLEVFKLPMPKEPTWIEGTCKPGFERVAEAFKKNFDANGEIGASVCLTVGGETVVDLWGGVADPKTGAPWTQDTVSIVFSCTKGATALCAHVLASRGKLDLDAPVVELWPEFGQHGKERVTTRMMLDHSAGVPALRAKVEGRRSLRLGLHDRAAGRRGAVLGARHAQRLSRLHLRLDGRRDGAPRVAASRSAPSSRTRSRSRSGLDFWIGLPEEIEPRVAPIMPYVYKADEAVTPFMTRPRDRQDIDRRAVLLQHRRLARAAAPTPAPATPPRSAPPTASPTRAGWPACTRRWPMAAASWSTRRRSPAWARSRWRRTTTPRCASRRALRSAS